MRDVAKFAFEELLGNSISDVLFRFVFTISSLVAFLTAFTVC